jgi:nitrogen fixation NifU-like protein
MADLSYSRKVIEFLRKPKNLGKLKDPDGIGLVGNPVCGDVMKFYLKVGQKNGQKYLKEIKFQTLGCPAAIAASSVLTAMAKGKSLAEARKIKSEQIVKQLGGLPKIKLHCSLLAVQALKKAIENYQKRQKRQN